jgi:hypothetical protein
MCLAIAGGVDANKGVLKILLLPIALLAIVLTNAVTWLMSQLWPDWKNIATGHSLELRKGAAPATGDGPAT